MSTTQTAETKVNWLDIGFKILSLFIIPLLGIGISMYADLSVMRERVSQIQSQQSESRTQMDTVNNRIHQISLTVQETNGQIRQLSAMLEFIKGQTSRRGGR